MWLNGDESFCRVSVGNVHERDNTVTYSNFELDGFTSYPARNSAAAGGSAARNSAARPSGASGTFAPDSSAEKQPNVESALDEMTKAKIAKLTQERDTGREQRDDARVQRDGAREQYDDVLVERGYFVGSRMFLSSGIAAKHSMEALRQQVLQVWSADFLPQYINARGSVGCLSKWFSVLCRWLPPSTED